MLTKQKNSPYWYAVLYNGGNRRKWVSTRTRSKKEAKIFHDEVHAMLKRDRAERQRREILGIEVDSLEPFPLSDVFRKYRIVRGEPSPSTVAKFNRFVKWLKANRPKIHDINKITKRIAFEYLSIYSDLSPKTHNNHKNSMSAIWNLLAIYDVKNIWKDIPTRTGAHSIKYRAYSDQEVKRILKNCTGFHYDAVTIAFHTGLRFKDICHLKIEDVNLETGTIEIIPAKTSRFRKAVYIHLHKDVIDVLRKAAEDNLSDYVFPESVARYSSGTFGVQFKRILKKANVLDNKHGKASFHSLRSTFITNCEEAGISRTVIQGIVGHGSPHMTERYSEDKKSGRILKEMPSIK